VGFKGFSPECGFGLIDAEKTVKAALALNINPFGSPGFAVLIRFVNEGGLCSPHSQSE
jgi:hypothetical protein